jgi:hypothetical protein
MNLNINTRTETRTYNQPIYGIRGEFTLSNDVAVPYFASLLDVGRMAAELKTHEQVAASLDQTYNLQELYQREIDLDRIDRDLIKNYLMDPNKIKFFNSLTVVLLPKDAQGRIIPEFQDFNDNDPAVPCDGASAFDSNFKNAERIIYGGVQFITTGAAGISRLRWDSTRIDAVAVDGQHRLTALTRWFENFKNKALNATEQRTVVPVIFLLLSENAGFKRGAHHQSKGIKNIAREIFTDLNKNAKTVDKATEIILDDRSLISRCVRELVTEETCQEQPGRLPLSLVRWRDANNRFDKDYYLNSLVHLNILVEDILDLPLPKSGMEKSQVIKFIHDVGGKLGDPTQKKLLAEEGKDLESYYLENYLDDEDEVVAPLTGIPGLFMNAAVEGFRLRYAPWIVRLLTEPRPYKQLIDYARQENLVKGIFSQLQSQPSSHQQSLKAQLETEYGINWKTDIIGRHRDKIEAMKGSHREPQGEQWLFKAIFQKALVRLGKILCADTPPDEADKFGGIDDLLAFVDDLFDRGILTTFAKLPGHSKHLWTFISLNPVNPTIQVTSSSERRIFAMLTVWYFSSRYALYVESMEDAFWHGLDSRGRANEIVKKFQQKQTAGQWPIVESGDNLCETILDSFARNAHVILGQDAALEDTAEKRAVAKARLAAMVELVISPQQATGAAEQDHPDSTTANEAEPEDQGIL